MIRSIVRLILCVFFIATIITIPACGPTQYNLISSVSPEGGGSVTPAFDIYEDGSIVNIIAIPATGYRFDYWSGNITGTTNTNTITMNGNKNVTAHFKKQFTLTVSIEPASSGNITPTSGLYDEGSTIKLVTEPAIGYRFDHWSGDITGTTNQTTITVNSDKNIVAHFTKASEATMSVIFVNPILLMNDQVKVTVTGISNVGDSAGSGAPYLYKIYIKPEYRDNYYLLCFKLRVENLTSDILAFGTGSMVLKNENGQILEFAGGGDLELRSVAGGFFQMVSSLGNTNCCLLWMVPNNLNNCTLYLQKIQLWNN